MPPRADCACAPATRCPRRASPRARTGPSPRCERLLERGDPAALCSHGPVLPTLLGLLHTRVAHSPERGGIVAEHLRAAADESMRKGEVLVCHLVGRGEDARVVDVERIDT